MIGHHDSIMDLINIQKDIFNIIKYTGIGSSQFIVILIHPHKPFLCHIPDLILQHASAISLGHLYRGLDHFAVAIPHQPDQLQRLHTPFLALSAFDGQHLQKRLVHLEFLSSQFSPLRGCGVRGRQEVLEQRQEEITADKRLLETGAFIARSDRLVLVLVTPVLVGCVGYGDPEVEFTQQRAWEVWILVSSLEDDAVEFALGNSNRPVRFFFASARQSFQLPGVKQWHPASLARTTPVLQDEQHAL